MDLTKILEKKGLEGKKEDNDGKDEYKKRYNYFNRFVKNPKDYTKKLVKKLKKWGLTPEQIERRAGTTIDNIIYNVKEKEIWLVNADRIFELKYHKNRMKEEEIGTYTVPSEIYEIESGASIRELKGVGPIVMGGLATVHYLNEKGEIKYWLDVWVVKNQDLEKKD